MLIGILLKIYIVKQSYYAPIFGILTVAEVVCIPFHNSLNGQTVLNMKSFAVVLFQKLKGFFSCDIAFQQKHLLYNVKDQSL